MASECSGKEEDDDDDDGTDGGMDVAKAVFTEADNENTQLLLDPYWSSVDNVLVYLDLHLGVVLEMSYLVLHLLE